MGVELGREADVRPYADSEGGNHLSGVRCEPSTWKGGRRLPGLPDERGARQLAGKGKLCRQLNQSLFRLLDLRDVVRNAKGAEQVPLVA